MTVIAVVDTETSRHPSHPHNRIVEIGIVLWDAASDAPIAEFETLVNPNSVIEDGSSAVHGLRASDLEAAPAFREVGQWLPHFLDERVVCGFNVSFDIQMLNYEFSRIGSTFRVTESFCAKNGIPGNNKRLEQVCLERGLTIENAHTALGDARATLEVIRNYGLERVLDEARGVKHRWQDRRDDIRPMTWSRYKAGLSQEFNLFRENAMWELEGLSPESQYVGLLSSIFEDRRVSAEETAKLKELAKKLGFSDDKVLELHEEYLQILESRALENRRVSTLEVSRVSHMAGLLGLESTLVADELPEPTLVAGSLICVTSTATLFGRSWGFETLSVVIEKLGCTPTNELRKKDNVSLLLCPETHVRTGKASKAIAWSIPMMSFGDFLEHASEFGVDLESPEILSQSWE